MTKKFLPVTGVVVLFLTLVGPAFHTADAVPPAGPSKPTTSAFPRETDLAPANLQYYWKRELKLRGTERVTRLFAMEENLYLLLNANTVRAVDAAVGTPRWLVNVGTGDSRLFEPTHVSDMHLPERIGTIDDIDHPETVSDFDKFDAVLFNSMTNLMVVDRTTGRIYRDVRFQNLLASDAGVSDGTSFYVGTGDKGYCAVKLMPNVLIWREHIGQILSTPMRYFEGRIFMGTLDGLLRCADVNNYGAKRWERNLGGSITQAFHVDAKGLFLACNNHRIYAFRPHTGKKLWPEVVTKGTVGGPIQMGEKTLFQYIETDGLYAVNVTNGDVRWKIPKGRSVLAIIDDVVYVLDDQKKLHLVHEITGKETAVVPLAGFDFYARNTASPAIYTATRAGQIFCIRPTSAGRITLEMLRK